MKWGEIAMGISLLMLLSRVCEGRAAECAELKTCEHCIAGDASLNLTDCIWAQCQSETVCISQTSDNLTDCNIHNESSMCKVLQLTSLPVNTTSTTTVSTTTTAVVTKKISTTTAEPSTTSAIPTTPVYSPSSFDPASFIGGIVLVLGAEAAFFFAVKFFKARDGSYQTLI